MIPRKTRPATEFVRLSNQEQRMTESEKALFRQLIKENGILAIKSKGGDSIHAFQWNDIIRPEMLKRQISPTLRPKSRPIVRWFDFVERTPIEGEKVALGLTDGSIIYAEWSTEIYKAAKDNHKGRRPIFWIPFDQLGYLVNQYR